MSALTTHVLDLTRGLPAAGMAIGLARLDGHDPGPLCTVTTNADGRTDDPLLAGDDLVAGRYELTFGVGAFFAATGESAGEPYLDVVPIRFGVAPGTDHLHVALLVTPWSYSTYRGS
jgi:5-hydroxyisourate hydrolase